MPHAICEEGDVRAPDALEHLARLRARVRLRVRHRLRLRLTPRDRVRVRVRVRLRMPSSTGLRCVHTICPCGVRR